MPQMMPINWIMMFIYFILTFILFNIMNYYIFYPKNKNNLFPLTKILKKNLNWKW
uniref:ATP synthase F0 subunit 8 n=1 Tax=Graphium cloanthus TaxID=157381 RepID=UPI002551EF5F|nr:ATP synthase F0 subunit 8 [Graphium cloanthus]WGL40230.1 ATP synthase F0 subunit 8 [Graphium cloanthus]